MFFLKELGSIVGTSKTFSNFTQNQNKQLQQFLQAHGKSTGNKLFITNRN